MGSVDENVWETLTDIFVNRYALWFRGKQIFIGTAIFVHGVLFYIRSDLLILDTEISFVVYGISFNKQFIR